RHHFLVPHIAGAAIEDQAALLRQDVRVEIVADRKLAGQIRAGRDVRVGHWFPPQEWNRPCAAGMPWRRRSGQGGKGTAAGAARTLGRGRAGQGGTGRAGRAPRWTAPEPVDRVCDTTAWPRHGARPGPGQGTKLYPTP